jgi:hypothetical protein
MKVSEVVRGLLRYQSNVYLTYVSICQGIAVGVNKQIEAWIGVIRGVKEGRSRQSVMNVT